MRFFYIFCVLILFSCNSVKVKNNPYKITNESIDFLAIGESTTSLSRQNHFESFGFPKLEDKIKLYIEVLPYTKELNKIYVSKKEFNQNQLKSTYVDSVEVKPEVLLISIADKAALVSAINSQDNTSLREYIHTTEKASIVTDFVLNANNLTLDKIKQADNYYLVQTNDAKYEIALFVNNKKTETLTISSKDFLAYQTNNFCWMENAKGKWIIGDLVDEGTSCKGKTYKKVQPKKEKSLYRM